MMTTARMKPLGRSLVILLTVSVALLWANDARAVRLIELQFDDGPDGSGADGEYARLLNQQEGPIADISLVDGARRTSIDRGKFGRAAEFDGDSASIAVRPLRDDLPSARFFGAWVALDAASTGDGWLFLIPDSFGVRLQNREIVASAHDGSGWVNHPTGVAVPNDELFHHIAFELREEDGGVRVAAAVDFGAAGTSDPVSAQEAPAEQVLYVGRGLDGRLDELLIGAQLSAEDTSFDRDPNDCGGNLQCAEEQVVTTPTGYDFSVSSRVKTVWDPNTCNESNPCPLLIAVSGGGSCADDYPSPGSVRLYAAAGFVVAAVDPYCVGDIYEFQLYPDETDQLIATKDFAFEAGAASDLVVPDTYHATGCSHGANVVTLWALRADDKPQRTFARSAFSAGACHYHGQMCEEFRQQADEVIFAGNTARDLDSEAMQLLWDQFEMTQYVGANVAAQIEYGASWGVDTTPDTPTCGPNGELECYEQGAGFTYAGRTMSRLWRQMQPQDAPTGYFFEYDDQDCKHCAIGDKAPCVACFLKVGRAGMQDNCPECLNLGIGEQPPMCELSCDEQGCEIGEGGDDAGTTDGGAADVADPDPPASDGQSSGCACSTPGPPHTPLASLVTLSVLGIAVRRLRRRGFRG
jgi:MYXO-CTERM domain-containing protein